MRKINAIVQKIPGVIEKTVSFIEGTLGKILRIAEKHFSVSVLACVAVCLLVQFMVFNAQTVTSDRLIFVSKAREILQGDFRPVVTHEIGWPLVIALISGVVNVNTVEGVGLVASVSSVVFASLVIVPTAFTARRVFNTRVALVASMLLAFWLLPIDLAPVGLSESFYILLLSCAFYFIIRSRDDWRWLFIAGGVMGYMAIMKINAVVVPVIFFIVFLFSRKQGEELRDVKTHVKYIIGLAPFFCIFIVNVMSRAAAFGDGFYYGANSNVFLDEGLSAMWAPNITESPTIIDWMFSHSFYEMFLHFGTGAARIVFNFFTLACPAVIVVPLAFGSVKNVLAVKKRFIMIFIVLMLVPNVLFFATFSPSRYLIVVIPACMMLVSKALVSFFKGVKNNKRITSAITIAAIASLLLFTTLRTAYTSTSNPYKMTNGMLNEAKTTWVPWGIANLNDSVIMGEEDWVDMIVSAHGDPEPMHAMDGIYIRSRSANVTFMRCVYYDDIDEAVTWMKTARVTHFIDFASNQNIPWTRDISTDPRFVLLYSFTGNHDTINIYRVDAA